MLEVFHGVFVAVIKQILKNFADSQKPVQSQQLASPQLFTQLDLVILFLLFVFLCLSQSLFRWEYLILSKLYLRLDHFIFVKNDLYKFFLSENVFRAID